jgi:tetratricopeptide (TPR) repeat protein
MLEAASGNAQAAEAALADNRRFAAIATQNIPSGTYVRGSLPEFLTYYGYPSTGLGYGAYAPSFAAGDFAAVREMARASARRLEALRPSDDEQALRRNQMLNVAYRAMGDASYRLKDYATADGEIKRALEIRSVLPNRTLQDERDAGDEILIAAEIAARQGKVAEAQKLVDPVLKLQRELNARGADNDDQLQRSELANALYVSALAGSPQKAAQLAEAAALLDRLPPEMRRMSEPTRLRAAISEEQKRQR